MFCSQCGKQISDAAICPFCGAVERQDSVNQPVAGDVPEQEPLPAAPPSDHVPQPEQQQAVQPVQPMISQSFDAAAPSGGPEVTPVPFEPAPAASAPPKKKKALIISIIAAAVVLLIGAGAAVFFLTAPMRTYNHAMELKEAGDYQGAIDILTGLNDYEDSTDQITDCRYLAAKKTMSDGDYDKAIEQLSNLNGYKDSGKLINECRYQQASALVKSGDYDKAIEMLSALNGYKDSGELISECRYQQAAALVEEKQYAEAIKLLGDLNDYKDSADLLNNCHYQLAQSDYKAKKYDKAAKAFAALGDYLDSKDMVKACQYAVAKSQISDKPEQAIAAFEKLGGYSDSKKMLSAAKMAYCKKNSNNTDKKTYQYLTELKKAKYNGADDLYKKLYSWKVTEAFWNASKKNTDKKSAVKSISSSKTACFHFVLTGGTPGEKATMTYVAKYPNGKTKKETFTTTDNYNWTIFFKNVPKGNLTVTIQDKSGNKLATRSVKITK